MKKRSILIIGNSIRTAMLFRYSLIKELVKRGHAVELVVKYDDKKSSKLIKNLGIKVHNLKFMRQHGFNPFVEVMLFLELLILIFKIKPDVVFSYFIKPSVWTMLASKILKVKNRIAMIEGRGSFLFNYEKQNISIKLKSKIMRFLIKFSLSLGNKVIVLNIDDENYFKKLGLNSEIYMLDGIGVDVEKYKYIESFPKDMSIGYIGRLSELKGVNVLLDLVEQAKINNLNWKFYFAGDFEESDLNLGFKDRFINIVNSSKNVEWLGFCDDIEFFFSNITLFVIPSKYGEGLPRSLMESFSFGRPVLGSTAPGISTSIDNGVDGFKFEVSDANLIYNKILMIEQDINLLYKMSRNARLKAESRFSIKKKIEEQIDLLVNYD